MKSNASISNPKTVEAELDKIANDSWYLRKPNMQSIEYRANVFSRYWVKGRCLELGPAEGVITERLAQTFSDLTCVEGSRQFCKQLQRKFPSAHVVNALFESFEPAGRFDNIVLGHVLEHVLDPVALLKKAKRWLSDEGRLFASVPNARSLHRQLAVVMGLLSSEDQLNDTDRHHGHQRVYNPETFRSDFLKAGLKIEMFGGYWIKPVSDAQLVESWTNEMLQAAMVVGERYPDIGAELYVIATR